MQDTAGGTTQVLVSSIAAARAAVDAGKLSSHRGDLRASASPGLPDVPSVSETIPGVVMNGWFARGWHRPVRQTTS